MSATTNYCRVVGKDIVRVTKLGGYAAEVLCPKYEAATGNCRVKCEAYEAGQLEVLLMAVEGFMAAPGSIRCTVS